jgi:hypothetical protein
MKRQVPGSIRNLDEAPPIAAALAAFVVGLGCIGASHAPLFLTRAK